MSPHPCIEPWLRLPAPTWGVHIPAVEARDHRCSRESGGSSSVLGCPPEMCVQKIDRAGSATQTPCEDRPTRKDALRAPSDGCDQEAPPRGSELRNVRMRKRVEVLYSAREDDGFNVAVGELRVDE